MRGGRSVRAGRPIPAARCSRARRPAGDIALAAPAAAAASSSRTIQSSQGTNFTVAFVPPTAMYVHVRDPGGENDGDELALLPGGRLPRSGHGLPIGLTSQMTRKPTRKIATPTRTGPCQPAGPWPRGGREGKRSGGADGMRREAIRAARRRAMRSRAGPGGPRTRAWRRRRDPPRAGAFRPTRG